MSPELSEHLPDTSNPIEHWHFLLHRAVGIDNDLFTGIKKLHLHMEEMEVRYNAIKGQLSRCFVFFLVAQMLINMLQMDTSIPVNPEGKHTAHQLLSGIQMMAALQTLSKLLPQLTVPSQNGSNLLLSALGCS